MIVDYVPLVSAKMRNFSISSEIIGNLMMKNILSDKAEKEGTAYAVATLDGTLMLIHNEEVIWFVIMMSETGLCLYIQLM